MIQIYVGWLGFHFNVGTVKGYSGENRDAKLFLVFAGIVGVCFWNTTAMEMIMKVLRLSVNDAALVANARKIIEERVDKKSAEKLDAARVEIEYWMQRHYGEREQSQKLLSESNTRCRDLETAVKVLTGYSKLPIGL